MQLPEILTRLETALQELLPIRGQLERDCSDETALALGRAIGTVFQAKALVEHDLRLQKEQEEADA
jgi:phosphomannomutase